MSVKNIILLAGVLLLSVGNTAFAKPALDIQHWQTTNGVPVYFVQATELPLIDIDLVLNAGSSRDGQLAGLAQLTNAMLNQGANALSADQIANTLDSTGATLTTNVTRDMATVSLRSLTDPHYLTPAVQLLTQIITQPDFPEDQFNRLRQQTLVTLKQQDQLPNTVAAKILMTELYGEHPYGHPASGTAATVTRLTRNDLVNFYQRYYVAKNAFVVLVGNLTKAQAQNLANQIVAGLRAGVPPRAITKPPILAQAQQQTIHFPSEQTHILAGEVIPLTYNNPDYFPLLLDNYILGGASLTSILFQQIREQRGLAYNAGSYLMPLSNSSLYLINLQTRNNKAAAALELTQQTLEQFIAHGPTASELQAAKNNAIYGLPLQLASNSGIAANVINIVFYHLPLNYLDTYRNNIQAVTLAKAADVLKKYLHPQHMATVIVGNSPNPPQKPA